MSWGHLEIFSYSLDCLLIISNVDIWGEGVCSERHLKTKDWSLPLFLRIMNAFLSGEQLEEQSSEQASESPKCDFPLCPPPADHACVVALNSPTLNVPAFRSPLWLWA